MVKILEKYMWKSSFLVSYFAEYQVKDDHTWKLVTAQTYFLKNA